MRSHVCPECGSVTADPIRAALHQIDHDLADEHYLCCQFHSAKGEAACGPETDVCCTRCPSLDAA